MINAIYIKDLKVNKVYLLKHDYKRSINKWDNNIPVVLKLKDTVSKVLTLVKADGSNFYTASWERNYSSLFGLKSKKIKQPHTSVTVCLNPTSGMDSRRCYYQLTPPYSTYRNRWGLHEMEDSEFKPNKKVLIPINTLSKKELEKNNFYDIYFHEVDFNNEDPYKILGKLTAKLVSTSLRHSLIFEVYPTIGEKNKLFSLFLDSSKINHTITYSLDPVNDQIINISSTTSTIQNILFPPP